MLTACSPTGTGVGSGVGSGVGIGDGVVIGFAVGSAAIYVLFVSSTAPAAAPIICGICAMDNIIADTAAIFLLFLTLMLNHTPVFIFMLLSLCQSTSDISYRGYCKAYKRAYD